MISNLFSHDVNMEYTLSEKCHTTVVTLEYLKENQLIALLRDKL